MLTAYYATLFLANKLISVRFKFLMFCAAARSILLNPEYYSTNIVMTNAVLIALAPFVFYRRF